MSYQGLPDALRWRESRYIMLLWSCLWLIQHIFLWFLVSNFLHFTEVVQHYTSRHNILHILGLTVISFHNTSPAAFEATKCVFNVDTSTTQGGLVGCPGSPRCTFQEWLHYVASQAVGRIGHYLDRYVDPLDVSAEWSEKGTILQLVAQTGTLKNICIVALLRPANIEIKEAVSVVYKSLKNTVPSFSVKVAGGIAHWGNDWDVMS